MPYHNQCLWFIPQILSCCSCTFAWCEREEKLVAVACPFIRQKEKKWNKYTELLCCCLFHRQMDASRYCNFFCGEKKKKMKKKQHQQQTLRLAALETKGEGFGGSGWRLDVTGWRKGNSTFLPTHNSTFYPFYLPKKIETVVRLFVERWCWTFW